MNLPTRSLLYGVLLGLLVVAAMAAVLEFTRDDRRGPVVTGEALVGGPFTLIDPTGKEVRDTDFSGRHMLIFFGYTHCPDVCPLGLQKISIALEMLEREGVDLTPLQPIFITIDPTRDSAAVMGKYISAFHPTFIALTGSEEAIAPVAEAYRVHIAIAEEHEMGGGMTMPSGEVAGDTMPSGTPAGNYMPSGTSAGNYILSGTSGGNYLMNHSSAIYLMGPDGRYVDHFNATATPRDLADQLRQIID